MPEKESSLAERAERAAFAQRHKTEAFFSETSKEVLIAFARNPNLTERDLLRLLARKDLPGEVLREIAEHKEAARHYAVKLAVARHPRTPRLVSLPILKFLHLFDLVGVSQSPTAPSDVKLAAEESILKQAETIPRGEKIALARRGTGRVAAAMASSEDRELIRAALDNPFLTEAQVIRLLANERLPRPVVEHIALHERWSHRYHLRLALVRNPLTPLQRVLEFLPDLAITDLREICLDRRMPAQVRNYVLAHCHDRLNKGSHKNSAAAKQG